MTRRQQRREAVRAALSERRIRRRWTHDAVWERRARVERLWYAQTALTCRCCQFCSPTACDEVFQGAGCVRRCTCAEDWYEGDYDDSEHDNESYW